MSRTPGLAFLTTPGDEEGQFCFDTNTAAMERELPLVEGKGQITLNFDRLDLSSGRYFLNVGVYEQNWAYAYDYHWHVYPLLVHSSTVSEKGIFCPPCRWEINDARVGGLSKY